MNTKCIVIGKNNNTPKLKVIEFNHFVNIKNDTITHDKACTIPSCWVNLELLTKDYLGSGYDLIFAYDNMGDRKGSLYLGKWNDGVV